MTKGNQFNITELHYMDNKTVTSCQGGTITNEGTEEFSFLYNNLQSTRYFASSYEIINLVIRMYRVVMLWLLGHWMPPHW